MKNPTVTAEQIPMVGQGSQSSERDNTEREDNNPGAGGPPQNEPPRANKTVSQKTFWWTTGVLIGTIVVLLVAIVLILVLSNSFSGFLMTTCLTKQCLGLAAMIKNYQNTSIDPCDDFYEHTCGLLYEHSRDDSGFGFLRSRELPYRVLYTIRNTKKFSSHPSEQMRLFVNQCMNQTGMKEDTFKDLREDIEMRGGFPFIDENWDESKFDLSDMLANYIKINRLRLPFIAVEPFTTDIDKKSTNILYVSPGPHHLWHRIMPLSYHNDSTAALIRRLLKLENRELDEDEFKKEFDQLVAFENELNKLAKAQDVKASAEVKMKTLDELQKQIPEIDWFKIIKAMPREGTSEADVKQFLNNVRVHGTGEYYFGKEKKLSAIINNTPPQRLANYIVFRQLVDLAMYFYDKDQPFSRKYYNYESPSAYCAYQLSAFFPMPATNVFIESSGYNMDNWKVGAEMFENIKKEYVDLFNSNSYLDPSIRDALLRKLDAITGRFGDNDYLDGSPALEKMYEDLNFKETDTPFQVYMKLWRHRTEQLAYHVAHFTRLNPVHMKLFVIYGAYSPFNNSFYMNIAYLTYPWMHTSFPSFSNYGYIGSAIGHEIGHGFDYHYRKVDEKGKPQIPWITKTNSSNIEFEKREKCFRDKYSSYKEPGYDFFMNGDMSRQELVADYMGVQTSFRAFKKVKNSLMLPGFEDVSDDKMFFYNYALRLCDIITSPKTRATMLGRIHPTNRFRVNGNLQNIPEFAETFKCPANTAMNPEKKCNLY